MLRFLATVLLAALASCTSSSKGPTRPAGAVPGPAVARTLGCKQGVSFRDAKGFVFRAAPNLALVPTDTIVVPSGALALIEVLGNHVVVRIDEELELKVSELAVLGAPAASASLQDQVELLLTLEEKRTFPDRMAGWYAGVTAANVSSPSAEPAAEPMEVAEKRKVKRDEQEESKQEESKKDEGKKEESKKEEVDKSKKDKSKQDEPEAGKRSLGGGGGGARAQAADKASEEGLLGLLGEGGKGGALANLFATEETLVATASSDALLRACLASQVEALRARAVVGESLKVRFRVEGGRVTLWLEGALPVPECAAKWFQDHASLEHAEGWQTIEVKL